MLLTTSFLYPVSVFHFWASAMIFLIFYRLYLFQTDHAVSPFIIGPFFLVLFCSCSPLPALNCFLVQRSSFFVSSFVQSKQAALHLITDIAQVFNAWNRFFALRWVFTSSVTLFWYTSFTFLFISSLIILSSFKSPRYLYPPAPASPISSPFGNWIPSHLVFFSFCGDNTAHFKILNSIFISSLHCHGFSQADYFFVILPIQF